MTSQKIEFSNNDYWFKIVGMLQQNWAIIESGNEQSDCVIYFISDDAGVFDQIELGSLSEAKKQLRLNDFKRYTDDNEAQRFISPPPPPFHKTSHPNGLIYSSGKYWKSGL